MSTLVIADLRQEDDLPSEKTKEVTGGFNPFSITRHVDKASPVFFEHDVPSVPAL